MSRPEWDELWLAVATLVGTRSRCDRRQIGAVAVTADNQVVATGYNGPPAHLEVEGNCGGWCDRGQSLVVSNTYDKCVAIHAEANLLLRADRSRLEDGTIYVSSTCCFDCAKLVANSGLARVVMVVDWIGDSYRAPERSIQFLRDSGLVVKVIDV